MRTSTIHIFAMLSSVIFMILGSLAECASCAVGYRPYVTCITSAVVGVSYPFL